MIFYGKTKRKANTISKLVNKGLLKRDKLINLKHKIYYQQKRIVEFIKEHRTIKVLFVFRHYSALIVVISSALLVSATNFTAGRQSSGFLFGYFGATENYENPLKDRLFLQTVKITNVALAPLAEAKTLPDPEDNNKQDNQPMLIQGQALVAGTSPIRRDPEEDGGVIIHKVKKGETISSIAAKYHITINTILWANEIENVDSIMPGDKIFILPVSGLTYIIKKNDTIDSIAKKYKAQRDKIITFNDLPANGKIKVGEKIVIPDGRKAIPQRNKVSSFGIRTRTYESFNSRGKLLKGKAGTGHRFPYGYCTWYVAQKKYIPWSGNAGTWLYHARSYGYATGKKPRVGAIMVSSQSWWGHVAVVERVRGHKVTVSEMNYRGWAKKDYRTYDDRSRIVKGYIY